ERSMREIVTLRVGTYANFIGSHFWNFQTYSASFLSASIVQGILTYTPRLVSVDFQGSLGSMSSRGTLYRNIPSGPSDVVTWTGNVSIHASEPRKKNLFLQSLDEDEPERVHNEPQSKVPDKDIVESLENDVQFWTDYSKVHYHPQSLYELNGQCMDSQEFNNYGIGRDAFSRDGLLGIQFMVDNTGGFSGVAAEFLESIADEFTNVPVLLYAVLAPESYTNARGQKQTISRTLHDAVSFSRLSSLSKLIVPVGLPSLSRSDASRFLCIKDEKPYHSSAVYASEIHSISLPFRMKQLGPTGESCCGSGAMDVYEVIQMLAGQARQNRVTILDVAMPAPSLSGKQAAKFLLGNLQPLTPETAEDMEDLQAVESMSIHGVLGHGGGRLWNARLRRDFYDWEQESVQRFMDRLAESDLGTFGGLRRKGSYPTRYEILCVGLEKGRDGPRAKLTSNLLISQTTNETIIYHGSRCVAEQTEVLPLILELGKGSRKTRVDLVVGRCVPWDRGAWTIICSDGRFGWFVRIGDEERSREACHIMEQSTRSSIVYYFHPCTGGHQASFSEVKDSLEAAYEQAITRPMFSHLSVTTCPLPIPLPFPSIFGNLVGEHGELLSSPNRGSLSRGSLDVESIPMAARLRSSSAVLPFLENRLANLRKYGLERGALGAGLARSWGFEKEELDDMGEVLSKMVVTLDPRSQASSGSD
ncbi:hypothetical protein RJ639_042872, partial [Escallonia herrerae]